MILRVLTRSGPMLTALCRRERLAVEEAAISISLYRGKVVLGYSKEMFLKKLPLMQRLGSPN